MSEDQKKSGNDAGTSRKPAQQRKRKPNRKPFGKGTYVELSATRHQARILAMQALYELDTTDHDLDEIIARMRTDSSDLPESARTTSDADESALADIPADIAKHAARLVRGTHANLHTIDPVIAKAAPAFPLEQVATIDRNVLRLAIYELCHEPDVPMKVAINEAVEIAKRYGGPSSGKFVNGVLGTVSRATEPRQSQTS